MPASGTTSRRTKFAGGYDPVQTKKALIAAGLALFQRNGFHGTSVKDIVDEAKLTKGAFYHHFESKEELLVLIHDEYLDYQAELIQRVQAIPGSAPERLRKFISAVMEGMEQYHANVTVFFQERRYLTGRRFSQLRARRERLEQQFHKMITEGVEAAEFRRDLDVQVTCLAILGMCAWTYNWFRPDGRMSAEEIAETFSRLVLDGLAKR